MNKIKHYVHSTYTNMAGKMNLLNTPPHFRQGFLQARFFWGGDSPKKSVTPPQNFYWLYFLPLGVLGYSPPPKKSPSTPPPPQKKIRWNPAGNPVHWRRRQNEFVWYRFVPITIDGTTIVRWFLISAFEAAGQPGTLPGFLRGNCHPVYIPP